MAVAAVTAFVAAAAVTSGATGGGSWLSPVKDRYEPGDLVTLVGYSGGISNEQRTGDPWIAYATLVEDERPVEGTRFEIGSLVIELTDQGGYLSSRVSITFSMPVDAAPGQYSLDYCRGTCVTEGSEEQEWLGDIIGAAFFVGVDPEWEITREWALNEPEIANMNPDGLIAGPGFSRTAADVLAMDLDENGESRAPTVTTTLIATTLTTSTTTAPSATSTVSTTAAASPTPVQADADDILTAAAGDSAAAANAAGEAPISPLTGGAPQGRSGWWLLAAAVPIFILSVIRISLGRDRPTAGSTYR